MPSFSWTAREDTRWFIVAVVILSLVLFLALPMSLLVLVETEKMKAEIRQEVKQLKKLKQEIKELKDSGEDKITDFDLIVVDEGSMVSTILLDYIKKKTALADTKIIFIGDKAQLPPVGEPFSPIWKEFKTNYELTEVERHQNSILDFVQKIRGNSNPVSIISSWRNLMRS